MNMHEYTSIYARLYALKHTHTYIKLHNVFFAEQSILGSFLNQNIKAYLILCNKHAVLDHIPELFATKPAA